jgi:hypothetical protein
MEVSQRKCLRHLLGTNKLDRERTHSVREKLGMQNIVLEIEQYPQKWLQQSHRMKTNRIPNRALQCKPKWRRNTGRRMKRWKDQLHLED